jgi:hypothetical protein
METASDVDALERLIGQLQGLHKEVLQLGKKSPNDAVNAFKLKLINKVIQQGNEVLTGSYRPFADFSQFDSDDVPSVSDVSVILSQYLEQAERYRSDNVRYANGSWQYVVKGAPSGLRAAAPTKIGSEK